MILLIFILCIVLSFLFICMMILASREDEYVKKYIKDNKIL